MSCLQKIDEKERKKLSLFLKKDIGMDDGAKNNVLYGDECPGERGNTRTPKFGEWLRSVWALQANPERDGMYVETKIRTGIVNRGTFYRLTDGKGRFWEYRPQDTVFLTPNVVVTGSGATKVEK